MSPELLSGCSRGGTDLDDDRYEHLLALDPVLRSIARARVRPDPFVWLAAGGSDLTNFAAMVLHIGSQQVSVKAALAVFGRVSDAAGGSIDPHRVDELRPERLRGLGLSRAEALAIVGLARSTWTGRWTSTVWTTWTTRTRSGP